MSLFEEILINTKNTFLKAGKSAEKLVGISKLKINAAEIKSQISNKLQHLGKIIYDANKANQSPEQEKIENLIKEIDGLHLEKENVDKKISLVKNKTKCLVCEFENDSGALFCTQCGERLSKNINVKI